MRANTLTATTVELRQELAGKGFLHLDQLVAPAHVVSVREQVEELFSRFDELTATGVTHRIDHPDGRAGSMEIDRVTDCIPELRASPLFQACQAAAADLLQCEPQLYYDHVIRKPAEIGIGTAWHQDRAYNLLEPKRGRAIFWIPLVDSAVESGCMQFVPHSPAMGLLGHHPLPADPHKHTLEVDGDFDAQAHAVPVRAGGATVHQMLTLHMTAPNRSPVTRNAWIIHFARPRNLGENVRVAARRLRGTRLPRL